MAEEDEEDEVEIALGEGPDVPGAPLSRVVSRLSWPRSKSDVVVQEGDTEIRTADGPRTIESILEEVDTPYFATRQEFVSDVRAVIGYDPVETAE